MFTRARLAAVVLWCAGGFSAHSAGDAFVEYLAGVEALRVSRGLSEEEKASYYRKLVEVTGVSTADAVRRIGQYMNRPEQWEKTYGEVASVLQEHSEAEEE